MVLKPCPHCGGTATFTHAELVDDNRYVEMTLRCCATLRATIAYPVYIPMSEEMRRSVLIEDLTNVWNRRSDDDPERDGTDAAHPAFWRGNDYAMLVLIGKIEEILDGKDKGTGQANEPWETTRRRMINLVQKGKQNG